MKTLKFGIPLGSDLWWKYSLSSGHYGNGFYFMVPIRGPKNGVLRPTASELFTCREEVMIHNVRSRLARATANPKDWFDKTRVVVLVTSNQYTHSQINSWMSYGLKHMHIIEKKAGWPLSKVYRLVHEDFAERISFFYFEGSRKWVHSPQMISLYMLLIRCGRYLPAGAMKSVGSVKSITGLAKHWIGKKTTSDAGRMRSVLPHINKVLTNYKTLFGRSITEMYLPKDQHGGWLGNEGIQKMISGQTCDAQLRKNWKALHAEK